MKLRLVVRHTDGQRAEVEVEGPAVFRPSGHSPHDLLNALFEMERVVNAAFPEGRVGLRLHIELQEADPLVGFARQKEGS